MVETRAKSNVDYKVGYKRPPVEYQFKPGQRANPRGRPRGSQNADTVVRRVLTRKISVRRGDKTHKVSVLEAITETHALKAAQGDHRSTGVVINLAGKTGLLSSGGDQLTAATNDDPVAKVNERASGALVESIDPHLLSEEEQIDLSRIADLIDREGNLTVLSGCDLERLAQIVRRAQRKGATQSRDVTPETSE
jgi:hypothetical protein